MGMLLKMKLVIVIWKPDIGCIGKFARISFNTSDEATFAGKKIRKEGFSIDGDVRLTGGYSVSTKGFECGSYIYQLVARQTRKMRKENDQKNELHFTSRYTEVKNDKEATEFREKR